MPGRTKTFLLGLGCQKGGSTWLHDYLHNRPDCDFGVAKEYHTFDARYLDLFRWFHARDLRRLTDLLNKKQRLGFWRGRKLDWRIDKLARKIVFREDPSYYAEYFDRLWQADPAIRLVGDITPGYAALQPEHYREIKTLLEGKGFDVKVIFILRDPVERCYSAVRAANEKKIARGEAIDLSGLLEANFATPAFECRTRYENTVRAVETVFAADRIFLTLHETLFTAAEIGRLNRFLGLDDKTPARLGLRVNASSRHGDVPADLAARIYRHYRPTYEFCAERFGRDLIAALWHHD